MLKLSEALSHGPGCFPFRAASSWIGHTEQVMCAALTPQERIGVICHDIPKLTEPWQDRAAGGFIRPDGTLWPSPHGHAAWGGAFAYLLLKELYPTLVAERFAIFHAVAAHHSSEGAVVQDYKRFKIIACPQVRRLAFQALEYFQICISRSVFDRIWKRTPDVGQDIDVDGVKFLPGDIQKILLHSRNFLGRLVLFDIRSAANQDPKNYPNRPFDPNLPKVVPFALRTPKTFHSGRLSRLRSLLSAETLKLVNNDLISIAAPTGCGKTQAYLELAEQKVKQGGYDKIVIALPIISILEQILHDYLPEGVAQIWNFLIQAKADAYIKFENNNSTILSTILSSPFSSPYNLTTYNQVFSAIISPHRRACVRSLYLKNAVIILDEVQKIPFHSLLYGLPLIQEYCKQNNCCLILCSATPLPPSQTLFVGGLPKGLPSLVHKQLFSDPLLMDRRTYTKIIAQCGFNLADKMRQSIQQGKREFFLLSLVSRGTFAVAKILDLNSDPFKRRTIFDTPTGKHPVIWLDGTVPPFLRMKYLRYIRRCLRWGIRITLLTTQVVEAGVDFGGTCFENGYTDFIDIASLLQRGGRVNREGLLQAANLFVFDFFVDLKNTTKTTLNRLQVNLTDMGREHVTDKVKRLICQSQEVASNYFNTWKIGETRNETQLNSDNDAILSNLFNNRRTELHDLVQLSASEGEDGLTFQFLSMVSDLYPSDDEESYLVFESAADMTAAVQKIQNPTRQTERELSRHRTRIPKAVVEDMCMYRNFKICRPSQSEEILLYR